MRNSVRTTATPPLNSILGWMLAGLAFGWGMWLDPWSMHAPPAAALAARQAQGVLLAMALLQLLVGQLLRGGFTSGPRARTVSRITVAGALCYAGGYAAQLAWPGTGWIIVVGALFNAVGFTLLALTGVSKGAPLPVQIALGVLVFGMFLDAVMGLKMIVPGLFPGYLGSEAEVRMRMLRLARVAAIALSVQAILFQYLADRTRGGRLVKWAGIALAAGAVGMPLILTASAFGPMPLKYLLPLPADAVLFGAGAAVWLAWRVGSPAQRWGWAVVCGSMAVGLLLGGFAFNGPLPAPTAFTAYMDPVRSLTRLGHAYVIVLGLLMLFAACTRPAGRLLHQLAQPTWMVGTLVLLAGMAAVALAPALNSLLALGPAICALGAVGMAYAAGTPGQDPGAQAVNRRHGVFR